MSAGRCYVVAAATTTFPGHRDTVTLVKNYDLKLEGPGRLLGGVESVLSLPSGLAELAGAIGNGPLVAVGKDVPLIKLDRREDTVVTSCSSSQQVQG